MAATTDSLTVDVSALRFLVNGANTPLTPQTDEILFPKGFATHELDLLATDTTDHSIPAPPGGFKFLFVSTRGPVLVKLDTNVVPAGSVLVLPKTSFAALNIANASGKDIKVIIWVCGA